MSKPPPLGQFALEIGANRYRHIIVDFRRCPQALLFLGDSDLLIGRTGPYDLQDVRTNNSNHRDVFRTSGVRIPHRGIQEGRTAFLSVYK
jgi:hypothetical protein